MGLSYRILFLAALFVTQKISAYAENGEQHFLQKAQEAEAEGDITMASHYRNQYEQAVEKTRAEDAEIRSLRSWVSDRYPGMQIEFGDLNSYIGARLSGDVEREKRVKADIIKKGESWKKKQAARKLSKGTFHDQVRQKGLDRVEKLQSIWEEARNSQDIERMSEVGDLRSLLLEEIQRWDQGSGNEKRYRELAMRADVLIGKHGSSESPAEVARQNESLNPANQSARASGGGFAARRTSSHAQ